MSQALFWSLPLHPLVVSAHDMESAETLLGAAEFVVIFVAARLLAEVLVRLSLPTLIGELVAGVIIGASGLHLVLPPEIQTNISANLLHLVSGLSSVPKEVVDEIYAETSIKLASFAQVGLYALLFLTGLESDLNQLLKVGVRALSVATIGVVLPFAGGALGLIYLFDVDVIPAIFAGAALTATSIGITAK
ncbi:MAG: cation:proton antiporter, partial [Synechococcus sp. SB0662_bin_45]|nr:cation:proton antiporter [Synechococcus sp. SB0662_bin_45]